MTEQELDRLIDAARERYHVPASPPALGPIWEHVEARAFGPIPLRPRRPAWLTPLAFAATLVLGVGLGYGAARLGSSQPGQPSGAEAGPTSSGPTPFVGVASDYLERTTALLSAVGTDDSNGIPAGTVSRARELLSTTRLVLDAGVQDRAVRELLLDLELVLAQIAVLPEQRSTADAQLITDAMDQREVLPRLTLLLADTRFAQ